MAKIKPVQVAKPEKQTTVEIILDLLNEHIKTTKAIVEDYVGGLGMETELAAAYDNLEIEIRELDAEMDFDTLLDKMKELKDRDIKSDELLEFIKENNDYDSDKVIELLDPSDVDSWATSNGYVLIKVDNMNLRTKLEDFIKTEIYPHLADQNEFLII